MTELHSNQKVENPIVSLNCGTDLHPNCSIPNSCNCKCHCWKMCDCEYPCIDRDGFCFTCMKQLTERRECS